MAAPTRDRIVVTPSLDFGDREPAIQSAADVTPAPRDIVPVRYVGAQGFLTG